MKKLLFAVACVVALQSVTNAIAQTYPSPHITMVVPAVAGGPTDAIARILAEHMRVSLGQPVIVENVGGAGGILGVGRVARATPDGYTIGIGQWSHYVLTGAVYKVSYDLLKDFSPVALIATAPQLIVARKDFPANNLKELIAWLKANPGKATAATGSVTSPPYVFGVSFQKLTDTHWLSVPYRSAGPALQALVAGQVDLMIDLAANSATQIRAGTIKAYAVTAKSRLAALPEIPTVDEAGVPGFYAAVWHAIWVPSGTPKDVIGKLNAAIVEALVDPIVRQRLASLGQEIFPRDQQSPDALGAFQKAEIENWWPIIKAAGITPK